MTFRDNLVSELTQLDERKRRTDNKTWNCHFLGLALQAIHGVEQDSDNQTNEELFTNAFTPSREMHRVAKKLGLRLDVDRGQWVHLERKEEQ